MAGKSSRFPNLRPKWMLTHPMSGDFMCMESIKGLNLDFFDNIYFTILRSHDDTYNITTGLTKSINSMGIEKKTKIVILENETSSQSETVYMTIKKENILDFIFIKDSDNFFNFEIKNTENQICFFNLNDIDIINARTKSYINMDSNGIATNIVEKKVISPYFSVGGYSFESSKEFCDVYERLSILPGECYISNIILDMILNGKLFKGLKTFNFIDWGTLTEWNTYCRKFFTFFVDLDGTLVTNTSSIIPPFIGEGKPIIENIEILRNMYNDGFCKIIITTSRSENYRIDTESELLKWDIPYDHLLMGLPHTQRVLINDFANSNPYPSAQSINIERNTNTLKNYLS